MICRHCQFVHINYNNVTLHLHVTRYPQLLFSLINQRCPQADFFVFCVEQILMTHVSHITAQIAKRCTTVVYCIINNWHYVNVLTSNNIQYVKLIFRKHVTCAAWGVWRVITIVIVHFYFFLEKCD